MATIKKMRSFKASDETWEKLRKLAEDSGISMSSYICNLIDMKIPKPIPPEEWRLLYSEASLISSKLSNINGETAALIECRNMIKEVLDHIVELGIQKWSLEDAGN